MTDVGTREGRVDSIDQNDMSLDSLPEVEAIPEGWQLVTVGDIAGKLVGGGTPSKSKPEYWGGDLPWASVKDLAGITLGETEDSITEEGLQNSASNLIPAGSVIVSTRMTVGEAFINHVDMAINQDLKAIFPRNDRVNTYFLAVALRDKNPYLKSLGRGTTVSGIATDDLRRTHLALPPLPEQRKIASVLTTVDAAIQKTEAIIEQAKRVKVGLMQDFFHGKHKQFDSYKSTPVGEIPYHWEVTNIGSVVKFAQYGISESLSEEGKYPIFRMNNIENGYMVSKPLKYIDLDDGELEKYQVEKGDILFNRTNSLELVGKTGIFELDGDYVFASYLVRLRANDRVDPHFLNYYMNSPEAQNRMMDFATKGVSQANINASSIQQVKLPVPPREEQREISSRLHSVDQEIEKNKSYVSSLKRLKHGLMQDLLTGRVRTDGKDIDILDEVAVHG